MTLIEYMRLLGWNTSDLSRYAGINFRTAKKAVDGEPVAPKIVQEIAVALSHHTQKHVQPGEIDGLNIYAK